MLVLQGTNAAQVPRLCRIQNVGVGACSFSNEPSKPRFQHEGCTPLIQSHILYSVKEHVQKRSYHQFKTSWCTKIKHFLED